MFLMLTLTVSFDLQQDLCLFDLPSTFAFLAFVLTWLLYLFFMYYYHLLEVLRTPQVATILPSLTSGDVSADGSNSTFEKSLDSQICILSLS